MWSFAKLSKLQVFQSFLHFLFMFTCIFATECTAADPADDLHFAIPFGCSCYCFSSVFVHFYPRDGSFGHHSNDDHEEAVIYDDSIQCKWDWSKADEYSESEGNRKGNIFHFGSA